MKSFRKLDSMFVCEECGKFFKTRQGLGNHIGKFHNAKEYYDKWLKEKEEGICVMCKQPAKFRNLSHGYNYVCEKLECLYKFKSDNLQRGLIKKYGKHASSQIDSIHKKQLETCEIKYGSKSPLYSKEVRKKTLKTIRKKYNVKYNVFESNDIREKGKKTKRIKYGDENYTNRKKARETNFLKYGVYEPFQSQSIREKGKNTMKNKYDVEYSQQNKDIHINQQLSSLKLKKYIDTNIYYRGSFELDFLLKYFNKISILNGLSFKYKFDNKNKIYHSDFYIPSLNLIVEIKNSWLAKRDKNQIESKRTSVIDSGFNYIMITDKDYTQFNSLLAIKF